MRLSNLLAVLTLLAIPACLPTGDGGDPDPDPTPDPVACGGWLGDTCAADEFCLFEETDHCGWADASGTCADAPEACYHLYAPVCACDGNVYSNDCVAHAAGTSVLHALDQQPAVADIEGAWTGAAPGGWDVQWRFDADGTFTKTDLIAPCPEGVMCVWSGVVVNQGTWSVDFSLVSLTYTTPSAMAGATTPPTLDAVPDCDGLTLHESGPTGEATYTHE